MRPGSQVAGPQPLYLLVVGILSLIHPGGVTFNSLEGSWGGGKTPNEGTWGRVGKRGTLESVSQVLKLKGISKIS